MHINSIGIDLGKTTFHLVAVGEQGKVVVTKLAILIYNKTGDFGWRVCQYERFTKTWNRPPRR